MDVIGNKRITELDPLNKLTGKEEVIIDNGDMTYRVTVDTLLGFIVKKVNEGSFPETMMEAASVVVIPEGERLPASGRTPGSFYLRECSHVKAQINAGLSSNITVSPNMALRIIKD